MASSTCSSESDNMEVYQCSVCLNDMLHRSPRFLNCHHSYCQSCLQKLVKNQKIECPTCRFVTHVPSDDVTKLPINFILISVKEQVAKLMSQKEILCQLCNISKAVSKCGDCWQNMCEECTEAHNKLQSFQEHNIRPLCEKHSDGAITHVCMRCVEPLCTKCIMQDHRSHQEEIKNFQSGLLILRENLAVFIKDILKSRFESRWSELDDLAKRKETIDTMETVKSRLELHRKLAAEAEQVLLDIEIHDEKNKIFLDQYRSREESLTLLLGKTENARSAPWKCLIASYSDLVKMKEEFVDTDLNTKTYKALPFEISPFGSYFIALPKWLKEPLLDKAFSDAGELKIKTPVDIAVIDDPKSFVIADEYHNAVFHIDADGKLIKQYETDDKNGKIKGVKYYERNTYILQEKSVSLHALPMSPAAKSKGDGPVCLIPGIATSMEKMCIISSDKFLVTVKIKILET